jgi:hypothetical protein
MEQEFNPYAAPAHNGEPGSQHGGPAVELFSIPQIAGASFLASVGAGAALIIVNERRLGRGARGAWALLPALATVALVMFVESVPSFLVGGAGTLAMYLTARALSGEQIDAHVAAGGKQASAAAVIGWSLLGLLGMVVALGATAFALFY